MWSIHQLIGAHVHRRTYVLIHTVVRQITGFRVVTKMSCQNIQYGLIQRCGNEGPGTKYPFLAKITTQMTHT